ncbi:MAG: helix-turn-helix domain-containing protein [Clostridium sp.]|uniref:helix-turn-helix domain-containing protein n=1 Tax=Clostridium sp. TaxID=1506 RepID=UPI00305C27B2
MYSFNITIQISDCEIKNIIRDISSSIQLPPLKINSANVDISDLNTQEMIYTVTEVATLLKTDEHTVRELIRKNILIGLKLGRLKVTRSELLRFLDEYNGKDLSDLDHIVHL